MAVRALNPTSWRSILILSSHLVLGLPMSSLSVRSPHQSPVCTSPASHACHIVNFYPPY
jgi:hypothetical protein